MASKSRDITSSSSSRSSSRRSSASLVVASLALCISSCNSFCPTHQQHSLDRQYSRLAPLWLTTEEEITKQLERARAVLAKSKAKLNRAEDEVELVESFDNGEGDDDMPFFAKYAITKNNKIDQVVKSRDAKTGLFTTDGEKMAQLSEKEQWEFRSLLEVFESEIGESEDVYSLASKQLAERDVAMSMYNLRKQMNTEDYRKIFDPRNRFIGEDN